MATYAVIYTVSKNNIKLIYITTTTVHGLINLVHISTSITAM